MIKPIEVKALNNYRLHLKFSDGAEGEVDLSAFAGKGVFTLWNDYNNFQQVQIGESGEIAWNEDVDMDSDTMYMQITGKTVEELFPKLRELTEHA